MGDRIGRRRLRLSLRQAFHMMIKSQPRLLVEERRRKILELVAAQERVTVEELVDRFGVSAVTVRGDLDALANAGAVIRSHGGALSRTEHFMDVPANGNAGLHLAEKERIAAAAVQMIRDGQTLILDAGTTTAQIARRIRSLKLPSVTVISNSLNIAMELAELPYVLLIMLGGMLRERSYSLVGPPAEAALRGLSADRVFLGIDGLDPDVGLTTADVLEAQIKSVMMQVAREVVVVADSSKFGRRSLSVVGPLHNVHKVITDSGISPEMVATLKERNLDVMIV